MYSNRNRLKYRNFTFVGCILSRNVKRQSSSNKIRGNINEREHKSKHMFSNKMIRALLVPIILEQLLNSIMGTADTMMVSNVGSAAISAVSLVDSINILVIQAFSALAAGGAIVCAQYIGQGNKERANESARQVLFIITLISVAVSAFCLIFRNRYFT